MLLHFKRGVSALHGIPCEDRGAAARHQGPDAISRAVAHALVAMAGRRWASYLEGPCAGDEGPLNLSEEACGAASGEPGRFAGRQYWPARLDEIPWGDDPDAVAKVHVAAALVHLEGRCVADPDELARWLDERRESALRWLARSADNLVRWLSTPGAPIALLADLEDSGGAVRPGPSLRGVVCRRPAAGAPRGRRRSGRARAGARAGRPPDAGGVALPGGRQGPGGGPGAFPGSVRRAAPGSTPLVAR